MRIFVARSIGTDTWVLDDITPYVSLEGDTISTTWRWDGKRPDCVLVGECQTALVAWHNADRWVVVTDQNVAPDGTFDVGDPTDDVFLDSTLSRPESNAVEAAVEAPRNTYRDATWRAVLDDALQVPRWRALFTDGTSVTLGPDR